MSLVGTATVALPLSQCNTGNNTYQPEFLNSILTKEKVREIGKAYLGLFKSEADKKQLIALISQGHTSQQGAKNKFNVRDEFQQEKTVIVNGWILSVTEARQSALLYLNS